MAGRIPNPPIPAVARDPAWLAHRYDPAADAIHFVPLARTGHRAATFLAEDYLPKGLEPLAIRRAEAMAAGPAAGPIHFVFHSAFCLSTLLARAFDRPGWAMGLKEPLILHDIVGWRRRREAGPDMAAVLDDVLTLLARPFGADEAVVVKPSNVAHVLAPAMLALRPQACAILLHAPLRVFLRSIAKKGLDGRLWVRTLLLGLLDDGLVDFGYGVREHIGHTDLQVAAVGWLAQQKVFADLIARFGAARVRTLDSETLAARPDEVMTRAATLFGLALNDAGLAEILAGPAFTSHSKTGARFAAGDRLAEHRAAADLHADEIEKVAFWAEQVAAANGIGVDPPSTLMA